MGKQATREHSKAGRALPDGCKAGVEASVPAATPVEPVGPRRTAEVVKRARASLRRPPLKITLEKLLEAERHDS